MSEFYDPADYDEIWLLQNLIDPDENETEFFIQKMAILMADGKRDEHAVRELVKKQLVDKRRHASNRLNIDKANIKDILR